MRTLVLNAGYEPVSVVSDRRALLLVAAGKASVLEDGGDPVVSPGRVGPGRRSPSPPAARCGA